MPKTASQFDQWVAQKRQRPIGICSACDREKELRQMEPVPLCGACYMKVDRQEKKETDPLAAKKDAKKREKKIRAEMNKVLNVVDALEGLVADDDLKQLEQVARKCLRPIFEGLDSGGGHGHEENERDRDDARNPINGARGARPRKTQAHVAYDSTCEACSKGTCTKHRIELFAPDAERVLCEETLVKENPSCKVCRGIALPRT